MTIANFLVTKWSTILLVNLNKQHVHASVMNRDYEGDVKFGNTVKISSIGRITINDYTRNAGMGGTAASPTVAGINRPEILQGSSLFLTIDQLKYFNFGIDDVDKAQMNVQLMAAAMKEAAYGIANTIDQFCNSTLQTGVAGTGDGTGNRLNARTIGTGGGDDSAFETIIDLITKLKENDVYGEYWCIVPPWYTGALIKEKVQQVSPELRVNGRMVQFPGVDVRESNNLSGTTSGTLATSGGAYTILAGVKEAATFAEQSNNIEAFRPQDGRNDAVKGFHDYGAKVTRPYALASCAVTRAS